MKTCTLAATLACVQVLISCTTTNEPQKKQISDYAKPKINVLIYECIEEAQGDRFKILACDM